MTEINSQTEKWFNGRRITVILAVIVLIGVSAYSSYRAKHSNSNVITSLSGMQGKSSDMLVGKRAELKKVLVKTTGSDDIAFWVYDSKSPFKAEDALLVYLDFDLQSKTHIANGAARLKDGQQITLTGSLQPTPAQAEDLKTMWKVSPDDADVVVKKGVHLKAETLDIQ